MVYGHKRNPNTVFSTESWHSDLITAHISYMNTLPRWQLAAGIMGSAIAGDESLHVAQFMAFVDDKKHITGITRIDLGARERCALERSKENGAMDPYTTSVQYRYNKATAQFGKNYIEFLLAEPTLKKMYTMLWMNLSNKPDLINFITTSSKKEFITQFNSIPELLKEDTLTEALSIINWNTIIINPLNSTPFVPKSTSIEEKIQELASEIARIDALRVEKMVAKAEDVYAIYKQEMHKKIKIINDLSSNKKLSEILSKSLSFQESLTKLRVFSPADIKCAQEMIQTIKTNVAQLISNIKEKHGDDNTNSFKQIQLMTELVSDLLRAATLNLQYFPNLPSNSEEFNTLNQALNEQLNQMLTINDCAAYCLKTSSPHKIPFVIKIMNATMQDPGIAPLKTCLQQNNLIEGLIKKGNLLKKATVLSGGELLLLKLSTRYDLNDTDLLSKEEKEKKEKEEKEKDEWELVQQSEPPEPPVLFTNRPALSNPVITDIRNGNFQNIAANVTKKTFTINNFTTPIDQDNKTALHYLMGLSTNNEASVDAISAVLQASIGLIRNTNLEILVDSNNKTPLDYLIENKHSSYIIEALKNKEIVGCFSTKSYTLQDFFPKNTFWNKDKSPGLRK